MGAVEAEHEIHMLRVSVQETLHRTLRETHAELAETRDWLTSAEAALVDALAGDLGPATAHIDGRRSAAIEARRAADRKRHREAYRRLGPRGSRGYAP